MPKRRWKWNAGSIIGRDVVLVVPTASHAVDGINDRAKGRQDTASQAKLGTNPTHILLGGCVLTSRLASLSASHRLCLEMRS